MMRRSVSHSRASSTSRSSRSSISSGGSAGSTGTGNSAVSRASRGSRGSTSNLGTSSFLVGRQRDRSAEMELFSQNRKPRSNYRRPSSLGLSTMALNAKSEACLMYTPLSVSRSHIVPKIPDHLKPEGGFERESEVRANYRNLSPARPFIHKIPDHLKLEGGFSSKSEHALQYDDKHAQRPFIHRLRDHGEQVQPRGGITPNSEYRGNFGTAMKGERATPAWIANFEKVTIDGGDTSRQ